MLDNYTLFKWALVQVAPNSKNPILPNWTNNGCYERTKWEQWIAEGYNIGVLTGKASNLTVIDIDTTDLPRILAEYFLDTLVQKTNKGYHLFYKYEPELQNKRIDSLKIDVLNDGRQCVIYPSVIDGVKRSFEEDNIEPQKMPQEVKEWLLNQSDHKVLPPLPKCNFTEGSRNTSLTQLGGILRKQLNPHDTHFVLNLINKKVLNTPLPQYEVDALSKSLYNYANTDLNAVKCRVLDYLQKVDIASVYDLERATREEPDGLANVLYELQTDGFIIPYRKDYKYVKRPQWKKEFVGMGEPVDFEMPYFNEIANFCWGDMILIGAQTGAGKTHVAMNVIQQLVRQNVKPYYITTESGSRFISIARCLGLNEGDFLWDTVINVENIHLIERSVTILDWLMIEDKSQTDKVFQLLQDQLIKTGGILIVFQQLKDFSNEWFAPNMCKQFPALAVKYIVDKEDNSKSEFIVEKRRDPKGKYQRNLKSMYNWATKEVKLINELEQFAGYNAGEEVD